jgi:hypothetical protein
MDFVSCIQTCIYKQYNDENSLSSYGLLYHTVNTAQFNLDQLAQVPHEHFEYFKPDLQNSKSESSNQDLTALGC